MLLDPQQQELRRQVRRLLCEKYSSADLRRCIETGAGYDSRLWKRMSREMGLTAIGIPESDGSANGSWVELSTVLEASGYGLAPIPLLSSVALAGAVVIATPAGKARSELIAAIAEGEVLALVQGAAGAIQVIHTTLGWQVEGTAEHVVDGMSASVFIVLAAGRSGPVVAAVRADAPGVEVRSAETFDLTRPQATVHFAATHAEILAEGIAASEAAAHGRLRAALALAAEQLGVARRCFDLALEHARSREQFGRPIGSFQALKHRFADLFVEIEAIDAAVYDAANAIDDQRRAAVVIPIIAAFASETALLAARELVQFLGGMGFTWEHDAHLLLRRAKASQYLIAQPRHWREELVDNADIAGLADPDKVYFPDDTVLGHESLRARVRAFLSDHLPTGWQGIGQLDDAARATFLAEWRAALQAQRLLAYSWPLEFGGGGGTWIEEAVVHEECHRAGLSVWNGNDNLSVQMLGNTLLLSGTEEQKRLLLPRILSGEDRWCQGYSEPTSGSDLASLRCSARLESEQWVLNGQKIWTSDAHNCNWIFVLARTDATAPKHRGITFLLVPLDQPGVDVRPIRNMTGEAHFCEVFFNDARTARGNVVGDVNDGWRTAMNLVGFERGAETGILYLMFRDELRRLIELARSTGAVTDPLIRQRLGWAYGKVELLRSMGAHTVACAEAGEPIGPLAAITKLYWSEYHQAVTDLAMDILGAAAGTPTGRRSRNVVRADEPGAPNSSSSWTDVYLKARAGTIYAGTSEMQRNTIAERILGLPK